MPAASTLRRASALVLLVLLAACARPPDLAAKRAQNPVRGSSVDATVGPLRLLAVRVEAPEDELHVTGDDVGLFLTIANDGATPDELVGVSTAHASGVHLRDGSDPPAPSISVPVPAGSTVSLQYPGGLHLELVRLDVDTRGGVFLPVLFRFAEAGAVGVDVFVQGFGKPTVAPVPATP